MTDEPMPMTLIFSPPWGKIRYSMPSPFRRGCARLFCDDSIIVRFAPCVNLAARHSSSAQRGYGQSVSLSDIQPGDIVCYNHHVGIYVGEGVFIHASTRRVVTDELDSAYYSGRYVGAVRIGAEP